MEEKTCSKCHTVKTTSDFYVRKKRGDVVGLQAWCKTCMAEHRAKWSEANPQRVKYHDRKKMLRGRYGEDAAARYTLLIEAQGGVCAICGGPEVGTDAAGRTFRLAVDHDHETGRIRGLLCRHCNQRLGMMGDNIEGVRRWLDYLESPPNASLPEVISDERWTSNYAACMECETTTVPHRGGGLCRNCYQRKARREGKVRDVPWSERKKRGALSPSRRPQKK